MFKKNYDYDFDGEVKLGSQTVDFYLGFDIVDRGTIVLVGKWEKRGLYGSPEYDIRRVEVEQIPSWKIVYLEIFGMEMDSVKEIEEFMRKTPGLEDQLNQGIEDVCMGALVEEVEGMGFTGTVAYSVHES